MRFTTLRTLAIAVGLLAIGWVAGRAQTTTSPDFELVVDAPQGETTVECVRGCDLVWVERWNTSAVPIPRFTYRCSGAARCLSGRIGGWVRKPSGAAERDN